MRDLIYGALVIASLGCGTKHEPRQHRIAIRAMAFDPAMVEVNVGDTIIWSNEDVVPHTATALGVFDSQQLSNNQEWRYTVPRAGDIAYGCTFHPTMRAAIIVR